jgi:hypothetical protein
MGAKEWTDEEVQAEIREAVHIVREDRFEKFVRGKVGGATPPAGGPTPPPGKPGDPPAEPKPKRKALWWGDALEDASLSDPPPTPPAEPPNA